MKIMALDLGKKRIGVSISDPSNIIAQGSAFILVKSDEAVLLEIEKLVNLNSIGRIVIGLPLHMNGDVGDKAEEARLFGDVLKSKFMIPISYIDERLTSVLANAILIESNVSRKKRKLKVDSLAATIILQTYLDRSEKEKLCQKKI